MPKIKKNGEVAESSIPKRTPNQRENDFRDFARLSVERKSIYEIAEWVRLNRPYKLSPQMVWLDLKEVKRRWREEAEELIEVRQARELATLDDIQRKAMESWARSIGESVRTVQERLEKDGQSTGNLRVQVVKEQLNGDPRYLQTVLDCVEKRCRILGVPVRVELSGVEGEAIKVENETHGLSVEHVERLLEKHYARKFGLLTNGNKERVGNGED